MNKTALKSDKVFMLKSGKRIFRDLSRTVIVTRTIVRATLLCVAFLTLQPFFLIAQSPRAQNDADDNVVFWPRLDFVIPFNVDLTGQAPREIRLEVSENGGRSWALESSGDVRTKQFHFKAKGDGEYQFRLKTLDNQGRSFDNPGEPLRIRVDTTKPVAKMLVDIDERGVMVAEFEIGELDLDVSSIQLAYQTEGLTQWREIAFDFLPSQDPRQTIGTASWSIPSGTRQLVVRLTAKDKAGNPVEVSRLPRLPLSASAGSNLQLASGRTRDTGNAIRLGGAPGSDVPLGPTITPQPVGSGLSEKASGSLPNEVAVGPARSSNKIDETTARQLAAKDQVIELQSKLSAQQQLIGKQSMSETGSRPFSADRTSNVDNIGLPDSKSSRSPFRSLTDEEIQQLKSSSPVSMAGRRSEQSILVLDDQSGRGSPSSSKPTTPTPTRIPGETTFQRDIKPVFSSSKAFSLDYNIDNDPDAPISSVELWGTADQGQTWQLWGLDPDRQSPFDIEVETEGLFGFRMVIVGSNGLATNRPRNGENADAWIHVDVRQPQIKILSALYGRGNESGKLVIEYQASDDFLPERPISLLYSQTPNGPWTSIANGARNNGRYVWPSDPSLPPTIYLRIEAVDSAGNVGFNQLDLPIDVEGLAPRGRIQGFRPIK